MSNLDGPPPPYNPEMAPPPSVDTKQAWPTNNPAPGPYPPPPGYPQQAQAPYPGQTQAAYPQATYTPAQAGQLCIYVFSWVNHGYLRRIYSG